MRAALVALAFATWLAAQQPDDLGELLQPIRERHGVPALGVAVIVDGELAALGVDGVRKYGREERVTADDRWHLGSCTKAMTATWIARLVEQGRLAWTTTVHDGLPELRDELHASARGITVAQLLQHRAGLEANPPPRLWRELFRFAGSDAEARTEVARVMLGEPLEVPAGERFLYSNAGYMIAGAIAERRADGDFAAQMRAMLFEPLGMVGVGFGPPGERSSVSQPWGHRPGSKGPKPVFADNPPSLGPAGTVHATLRDWARFARLHLGALGEPPLLKPASLRALHTPPDGADYAFGWRVTRRGWAPGPILTHNGSNTMWFCVAWLAPEAKFAVLVTCNQGEAGGACDDVAAACIRRFRQ